MMWGSFVATDELVMTFSTVKALVRMLKLTPGFRKNWEEVTYTASTERPIRATPLFTIYSRYIAQRLIAKDLEGMEPVFKYIEEALTGQDDDISNAAAVSFLENLLNRTPSEIAPEVLVPLLGPQSRVFCRAWDEWTGVRTPGLW